MYAEPVHVDEHKLNEVPNYGTGFSPYFLSLGLFVGALIATLVVPTRGDSVSDASGWNRFVSKTLAFTIMSGVQSLLASGLVLYGLGLKVQSVPLFLLFSFVTSLSFMYIIQALVTWLENPGRFIAILSLHLPTHHQRGNVPTGTHSKLAESVQPVATNDVLRNGIQSGHLQRTIRRCLGSDRHSVHLRCSRSGRYIDVFPETSHGRKRKSW